MFEIESTKIIQLLANHQLDEAVSLFKEQRFNKATDDILQYLIYLEEDSSKAVNFYQTIEKEVIDPLMRIVIEPYNYYIEKDKNALQQWLLENQPENVFNVIEANNLAFYANYIQSENKDVFLQRAQALQINSELMKPIQQAGDFQLFSPITMFYVHYQVIRFLQDNFETQEDLDKMIQQLKNDKPI